MGSFLSSVTTGKIKRPRRTLVYGPGGVGKTTFAAMFPGMLLLQAEDGSDDIDFANRGKLCQTFDEIMAAIVELYQEKHDWKGLAPDSLDWIESLIWNDVCAEANVKSIEDIDYGKGYVFAMKRWDRFVEGLEALRRDKGMEIVLIAHARQVKVDNPETESFDRYEPALHKLASAMIREWCDEVFFATYSVHTVTEDKGFGKTVARGIGSGERVIRTQERPAFIAKNRLSLPFEFPLDYREYAKLREARQASKRSKTQPETEQAA